MHVSVLRIMDALIDISLFDCLHMEEDEESGGKAEERGRNCTLARLHVMQVVRERVEL